MEIIQVMIIVFALFAFSRVVLRFKDNEITLPGLLFWSSIWTGILLISFVPPIIIFIAGIFGIATGTGLLVYGGVMLLFYLVFRLYVQLEKQNQTITRLVREIAIRESKKKGKKD